MSWTQHALALISLLASLLLLRLYLVLPPRSPPKRRDDETCSLAVFLGSGGHTAEMTTLLRSLPFDRYTPRTYVYCHGDDLSLRSVASLEAATSTGGVTSSTYTLVSLPRARRVGQSWISTLFTALQTVFAATYHLFLLPLLAHPAKPFADLLIVNGPGTCVVLVLVTYIRRILGLRYTRVIYVESFARVKSLSLSGKLLRPFVDRFIVQWPDAAGPGRASKGGQVVHRGWLV